MDGCLADKLKMSPTSKLSTARKICCLLTSAERRSAELLLGLMFIGIGLAKQVKVKILQASTSEVYGDPQVHPQTEDHWGHVNPVGLRCYYDEGKRCAETLFFDYHRQHQLRIKVTRIFNISILMARVCTSMMGEWFPAFIVQALKGGEPITIHGNSTQPRSFVVWIARQARIQTAGQRRPDSALPGYQAGARDTRLSGLM